MPLTVTLEKAGLTLIVNDEVPMEKIVRAMRRKDEVVILRAVSGKRVAVLASDITLVREITTTEVEENKKKMDEMKEQEKRFTPAPGPRLAIPGQGRRLIG